MADNNVPNFVSELGQRYASYIQKQVGGLSFLPSAARENISNRISSSSSASGSSGQGASPAPVSASGGSDTGSVAGAASRSVGGAAGPQETIDYIRTYINDLLPSDIASAITANFPGGSSSSEGGSTVQSSVPAGVQTFLAPNAELRNFLSTSGDQSS